MMYHSSWDWRMPVVDKIESMEGDFSVNIDKYSVEIRPYSLLTSSPFQIRFTYNDGGYSNAFNKGHALYKAIVEFVKWFNQNQKS